jgi:hypothetical protein
VDHETRDYFIDPWRAVGFDVSVEYGLTILERGTRLSQVSADAEALRLFELLPGHVLGVDITGAATAGTLELRSQLVASGGLFGLRGYLPSELLSRANVIGRVQLRDDYVTDLSWNLLHFTTVRGFGGTLFADAAALTSCDGYSFSRQRVFTDVGYSFRVLHDAFGVYQQLLSVDLAFPLASRAASETCLGQAVAPLPSQANRLFGRPFTLLVTFLPNF